MGCPRDRIYLNRTKVLDALRVELFAIDESAFRSFDIFDGDPFGAMRNRKQKAHSFTTYLLIIIIAYWLLW
jgi:hypothetical protein